MGITSSSFPTYLIIGPTCFFLGILFTNWSYDHPLLWTTNGATPAMISAVEAHYSILHNSPPIIGRLLHALIGIGIMGFVFKLHKPTESNMLFDGASLVLYMIGVCMYLTNIIRGLRTIDAKAYNEEIGQLDTLRLVGASHTILALVLVGVLGLQAGQWYAEKVQTEEEEKAAAEAAEKAAAKVETAPVKRNGSKKKD